WRFPPRRWKRLLGHGLHGHGLHGHGLHGHRLPSPCRYPPFPRQARDRRPSPSKPKPPPLTTTAVEDIRPPAPYAPCREPRDPPGFGVPKPGPSPQVAPGGRDPGVRDVEHHHKIEREMDGRSLKYREAARDSVFEQHHIRGLQIGNRTRPATNLERNGHKVGL